MTTTPDGILCPSTGTPCEHASNIERIGCRLHHLEADVSELLEDQRQWRDNEGQVLKHLGESHRELIAEVREMAIAINRLATGERVARYWPVLAGAMTVGAYFLGSRG